jgi:hypothetical protein
MTSKSILNLFFILLFFIHIFVEGPQSFTFWNSTLKKELDFRFPHWDKNKEERNKNLKHEGVYLTSLFSRLQKIGLFLYSQKFIHFFFIDFLLTAERRK